MSVQIPTKIPARRVCAFSLMSKTERIVACAPGIPHIIPTNPLAIPCAISSLFFLVSD